MLSNIRVLAFSVAAFSMWGAAEAVAEGPAMPPKEVLLEKQVDLPANKVNARVIRVIFPKGYKTPEHVHDGPGPRYVLKGRLKIADSGQIQEYGPGQVFWESGQTMTAENISDGEAEIVIFELAPPPPAPPVAPATPATPATPTPAATSVTEPKQ
jgi:quercetin dioxygenase-like cupin family protein